MFAANFFFGFRNRKLQSVCVSLQVVLRPWPCAIVPRTALRCTSHVAALLMRFSIFYFLAPGIKTASYNGEILFRRDRFLADTDSGKAIHTGIGSSLGGKVNETDLFPSTKTCMYTLGLLAMQRSLCVILLVLVTSEVVISLPGCRDY